MMISILMWMYLSMYLSMHLYPSSSMNQGLEVPVPEVEILDKMNPFEKFGDVS